MLLTLATFCSAPDQNDHLLERLAYHYGTDKSRDDHKYVDQYAMLFDERRMRVHNVTEVGVSGGQSLQVWAEYFPNAKLWGVDPAPLPSAVEIAEDWKPRITLGIADSMNVTAVELALPGMTGFEAIARLRREAGPDLPVIALSPDASHDSLRQASMAGAAEYVLMPFDPATMEHKIENLLGMATSLTLTAGGV